MRLEKDFSEYTQEEKIQFMYKALVQKESDLKLSVQLNTEMENDLTKARKQNQILYLYNLHYSKTNYFLWFGIFTAFIFGFWIRGF